MTLHLHKLRRLAGAALIACGLLTPLAAPQAAADRILEGIEYQAAADHAVVRIALSEVVNYVKHFPERRGNTLEIQVRLPNLGRESDVEDHVATEVVLAPVSETIPLVGVTYEGSDPLSRKLIIRFSQAVEYQVESGGDGRSLLIRLPNIKLAQDRPAAGAEPLLTMDDVNFPDLASERRVTDEQVRTLLEEGKAALAQQRFNDAIKAFSDVLDLPDHNMRREAERLLAQTRETARELAYSRLQEAQRRQPLQAPPQTSEAERTLTQAPAPPAMPAPAPQQSTPPSSERADAAPRRAADVDTLRNRINLGQLALEKGDPASAVRILSSLLEMPEHPFTEEAKALLQQARAAAEQAQATAAAPQERPRLDMQQRARILIDQARKAMEREDFRTASRLLSQVVAMQNHSLHDEARRLLTDASEKATAKPRQAAQATTPAAAGAPEQPTGETATAPGQPTSPPSAAESPTPEPATAATAEPAIAGGTAAAPPDSRPRTDADRASKFASITDPAKLLELGQAALRNGDTADAIAVFEKLLNMPQHPFMDDAQRLLRIASNQAQERSGVDLRGPIIGDPTTLEDVQRIMEQGRLALKEGDLNRAIVAFTKLTEIPEHPHTAEALELLGVARQRNSQAAHAKAAFDEYLKRFPKSDGATRVQQRRADLIAAQMAPVRKLVKEQQTAKASEFRHDVFGSVSQYYYYGLLQIEDLEAEEEREDQSSLLTYVTANSRSRNDRYDIRSFFYATHNKDFLAEDDQNRVLISNLYLDFKDQKLGWMAKLGRQSSSTAGVLGRFDGLLLGYDISPDVHVNAVAGFPVNLSNKDSLEAATNFVGFNVEVSGLLEGLDVIPYVMLQQSEGLLDRLAIGEEIRFFHPRFNVFNLLDYDVSYNSLNIFLLHGQVNLLEKTTWHFNLDARNSPLIFTRNAIINQTGITSLDQLLDSNSEDEVRDMAEDRTGRSTSITTGFSHSFNQMFQWSGDVTWSRQQYAQAMLDQSPGLDEAEDYARYSTRLTTTGLLASQDISILALDFTDGSNYENFAFALQNRLPFAEGWRVGTSFRLDLREMDSGERLTRYRPSMKFVYNWKRRLNLEAEIGTEISQYDGETQNNDSTRTFGSMGYRWTF